MDNNSNNNTNNKFLLSNGNNFNNDKNKQEQIMNYLNNSSKYYSNENVTQSINTTTNSAILNTTSYPENNSNVNNNSIYINSNNNLEDHELDLWLREFTMDNFPLNANNIPNVGNNNNSNNNNNNNGNNNHNNSHNDNSTINTNNNNENINDKNFIENQYNSSHNGLLNQNTEFGETAAKDKYLKIKKLKNMAIEDRAKKNEEMENYTQNISLLSQPFNLVNQPTSSTYQNKSYLNDASTSSKFPVTNTLNIYDSTSSYSYPEGYKQISNLPNFLMNEQLNKYINNENNQSQHNNNSYASNDLVVNKKDNLFDLFNMVNSPVEKDISFMNDNNSTLSKSSDYENNKTIIDNKEKALSIEEKLNDKRKRNNAASARFRAKKKLKEQMTDLTAKEMTLKAQDLEIKVKEMELEIKWLRSLVTKNMESKTLKDIYEENGYLFTNKNDASQSSQPSNNSKLISISDSVKSYTKCCCNIDKSKGGTCGKNGTIGHCKCGGIGYCLMNVNMNKNKKVIKPKIATNQYPPISKNSI